MRTKIFAAAIMSMVIGGCGVFSADNESGTGGGKAGTKFIGRVVPFNFKNTASGHRESFSMLSDSVNGIDGNLPHKRSKSIKGVQDTQVAFVKKSSLNILRDAAANADSMQPLNDYDWGENPGFGPDYSGNQNDPSGEEEMKLIGCKVMIDNLDKISKQITDSFQGMDRELQLTANEEIPEEFADQIEKLDVEESDKAFHYVLKIDEQEIDGAKVIIDGELSGGANETQAYTKFSGKVKAEFSGGSFEKSKSPGNQTQQFDFGAEFAVFIDTEQDLLKLGGGVDVTAEGNSMKFAGLVSLEGGSTPGVTYEFEASGDDGQESFDMESTTSFKMTAKNRLMLEQTLSGSSQGESMNVRFSAEAAIDRFGTCSLIGLKCEGSEEICEQLGQ